MSNNLYKNNQYNSSELTQQQKISSDIKQIKQNLESFKLAKEKDLPLLPLGIWIKYVSKTGLYRVGGVLTVNQAPVYFMLKNPSINKSWSVDLTKNHIYIKKDINLDQKSINQKKEEEREKDILYKLYQQGLLEIIEKD
tara:strand:- start:51 stop:467 length:417 start_codon:yes stop_codon:yes gene_type:complete